MNCSNFKTRIRGVTACLLAMSGALAVPRAAADPTHRADQTPGVAELTRRALSLEGFESQCTAVEEHLRQTSDDPTPRVERLVRLGGMLSSYGVMDHAAAAHLLVLREGQLSSELEPVLLRLGRCLAPVRTSATDVIHRAEGPEFIPKWSGRQTPTPDHLQRAIAVYELAATPGMADETRAEALLAMAWVCRAMNDWDASTAAWLRCANELRESRQAQSALWHAAENLEWTAQPKAAADVLRRVLRDCPAAGGREAIELRIEELDAQARRDAEWLRDPVASLVAEIENRDSRRNAHAVFRSVSTWLEARSFNGGLVEVSRWAAAQTDWPREARISAYAQLARVLLEPDGARQRERDEAAAALGSLLALATCDSVLIPAGVRRAMLLRELGRPGEALATLNHVEGQTNMSAARDGRFLAERVRVHVACGDYPEAASDLERLIEVYPDHPESDALRRLVREGY
jgi:tetratricopeptide (TPR) repeat protein